MEGRPFLKWVGGKGQLLPKLLECVPSQFKSYHEPFLGGGALFFALASRGKISRAYLSDLNASLIDVYVAVRDNVEGVIRLLKRHKYDRNYYYKIRALQPASLSLTQRAARIIYLNKTCYNGLYRENKNGFFNVPFGDYKNPNICDAENLRAASFLLQGVSIACQHYSKVLSKAKSGDFVYFDPPYHPLSSTSNFTAYSSNGFDERDQRELQITFEELTNKGINAMVSNSDTLFIRDLYSEHNILHVLASRSVNAKATARGKITELIISNFSCAEYSQPILLDRRNSYRICAKGKSIRGKTAAM